jgi:hypothetical protein
VNNPLDVGKKKIIITLNLDLLCCAIFALVNWGSSRAWIGAYFLGHIEKTMIHHKLSLSLKSFGHFQNFLGPMGIKYLNTGLVDSIIK